MMPLAMVQPKPMIRVLAVDDQPLMLRVMGGVLRRDFDVRLAEGAAAALLALEEGCAKGWQPDVVLLDWMMPGTRGPAGGGLEVLRAVRKRPQTARVPVIILSAADEHGGKAAAIAGGANDWMQKPWHPDTLQHAIRRLAETHPENV